MDPYSAEARAKQAALEAKIAAGEEPQWSDLFGLFEPNPDLPDCQSEHDGYRCGLENHHDGPHRRELTW